MFLCGLRCFHMQRDVGFGKKKKAGFDLRDVIAIWSARNNWVSPKSMENLHRAEVYMGETHSQQQGRVWRHMGGDWALKEQSQVWCLCRNARAASHPSWGFLHVEAVEVGRGLAVLHGLSFTLPGGLFTLLEGEEQTLDWIHTWLFSFYSSVFFSFYLKNTPWAVKTRAVSKFRFERIGFIGWINTHHLFMCVVCCSL